MKNRRKKPGVKLTRAQKKKLEELTRQAKADGRHPNSAQKTIPYLSMYKDGLCRVTENYYTMSLLFDDMKRNSSVFSAAGAAFTATLTALCMCK